MTQQIAESDALNALTEKLLNQAVKARERIEWLKDDLTGHQEAAVKSRFGAEVDDLDGTVQLRALAFGVRLNEGMSEDDAYDAVMASKAGDVRRLLGLREDDLTQAAAPGETAADPVGEGDSGGEPQPETSPAGV